MAAPLGLDLGCSERELLTGSGDGRGDTVTCGGSPMFASKTGDRYSVAAVGEMR